MTIQEDFICNLKKIDANSAVVQIVFVKKGRSYYSAFEPNITYKLKMKMVDLIINDLQKYGQVDLCNFDPVYSNLDKIEFCNTNYVGNYSEVIDCMRNAEHDVSELQPDDITFYCIRIDDEKNKVNYLIFRRISKLKRLNSKGIVARFFCNELNEITDTIFGIDGCVDFIIKDDKEIYIFNHVSLERIFKLNDKYFENARTVLQTLKELDVIENFENFEEDCLHDIRYQKRLTKVLGKIDNISDVFNNFDNIQKVIDEFDLDIEVKMNGMAQIVYEGKEQLNDILHIINDAYYKSIINNRKGIDEIS